MAIFFFYSRLYSLKIESDWSYTTPHLYAIRRTGDPPYSIDVSSSYFMRRVPGDRRTFPFSGLKRLLSETKFRIYF
jgi:hypothetical protein